MTAKSLSRLNELSDPLKKSKCTPISVVDPIVSVAIRSLMRMFALAFSSSATMNAIPP